MTTVKEQETTKAGPYGPSGRNSAGWDPVLKLWFPYKSREGGADTVGIGHKIKKGEDFRRGITDSFSNKMFGKDWLASKKEAKSFADNGKSPYNKLPWDRMSERTQLLSTDAQFNAKSGIAGYPKFLKAVYNNDIKEAVREYQDRGYTPEPTKNNPNPKKVQLTNRINAILGAVGLKRVK